MGLIAGAREAQLRIQQELTDALEQCQVLRSQDGRQLLTEVLSSALDSPVSLHGDSQPRQQLVHVVLDCCGQTGGLHGLVDSIRLLEPRAPALEELTLLCDEWHALRALPTNEWARLRETLLTLCLSDDEATEFALLRKLVGIATEHRVLELPRSHRTVWAAFLHLAGANAAANSLPPAMIFLDCVADQIDNDSIATDLRRLVLTWAEQFELTDRLDRVKGLAVPRPKTSEPGEPNSVYLVIQLDPVPADPERFLLSHWRQWDGEHWGAHHQADAPVPRAALENEVDLLVRDVEIELGAHKIPPAGAINLEFVVPWEMLNTPVEFWKKSSMSHDTVPLAIDHPVVLRSLERMRYRRDHLAWKQRWKSLTTQSAANRLYQGAPSGDDYFTMLATHLMDDQIVGFVLSEPPKDRDGTAWREASMAFRAGIPAIIWDREDCSSKLFREALERMLDGGSVTDLPQRIAELRRDALRQHFSKDIAHAGTSMAILWENPDRLPDSGLWFDPEKGTG